MYKSGDIVLVKMHPSSGHELKKFRPAVVLQEQINRKFVTFIPFSSNIKIYNTKTEFVVQPSDTNYLEKPSLLLCWYIQTVGTQRIQRKIGILSQKELQKSLLIIKQILL